MSTSSRTVTIRMRDYVRAFEEGPNNSEDIRAEKAECRKHGPSLRHIADLCGFGDDVLIEENQAQVKDRIPRSGHTILVHGETPDQDTRVIFTLEGFGPLDLAPGEKVAVNMRQRYAIRQSERTRRKAPKILYDPSQPVEDYYG